MNIETIFEDVLSVPQGTLNPDTPLKSVTSWDSMTHMILITRLEEHFNVRFTGDEIADMNTIADARRYLAGHGVLE